MFYFSVKFKDGRVFKHEGLTQRQAVLRYNKWLKELAVLPIKEVAWGRL
jgi:hypothetical protein